jgi:hypothetical protein
MSSDAERQLKAFIGKFDREHQALIRSVRAALRKRLPGANELVYDNYNFFVIGYGPTERPSDCILSIAAGASGVSVCFVQGARLHDPHKILVGSGKQTRFLRLESAEELKRPEVEELIAAAVAEARAPFETRARGRLIIRSVSAKQRPRRRGEAKAAGKKKRVI